MSEVSVFKGPEKVGDFHSHLRKETDPDILPNLYGCESRPLVVMSEKTTQKN